MNIWLTQVNMVGHTVIRYSDAGVEWIVATPLGVRVCTDKGTYIYPWHKVALCLEADD